MDCIWCDYYNSNVCNNWLDLAYYKMSDGQWQDIVHCLTNQPKIPLPIRVKYVNLKNSNKTRADLPSELLSQFVIMD